MLKPGQERDEYLTSERTQVIGEGKGIERETEATGSRNHLIFTE